MAAATGHGYGPYFNYLTALGPLQFMYQKDNVMAPNDSFDPAPPVYV